MEIKRLLRINYSWRKFITEPWYPILYAVYPPLFLYSHNINEVELSELWVPLLSSLVGVIVLFLLASWLLRNWFKAALWTVLVSLCFFSYNFFAELLPDDLIELDFVTLGDNKLLFPALAILFIALFVIIRRSNWDFSKVTIGLNGITALLVIINLFQIVPTEFNSNINAQQAPIATSTTSHRQVTELPDIYYFIFDWYGGEAALWNGYQFNNHAATEWLENQGFYVARSSRTNYLSTNFSLSATFNMRHHRSYVGDGAYPRESINIYPQFKHSEVINTLRSLGYKTYADSSWHLATAPKDSYDHIFTYQGWMPNNFMFTYLKTTMALPIITSVKGTELASPQLHHRAHTDHQFNSLPEIVKLPGPKFVFAHFLIPHSPYIYDSDCSYIENTDADYNESDQGYIKSVQCANTYIQKIVPIIKNESGDKAVIIVQSDEGANSNGDIEGHMSSAFADISSDEGLMQRANNLNGIYLPSRNYDTFYDSQTSINTFPLIFNEIFGTNYQLLPDTTFAFEREDRKFNFVDVTKEVEQQISSNLP